MKHLPRTATFGRKATPSERRNRPRANDSKRYVYLEDAAMSRAMYRL